MSRGATQPVEQQDVMNLAALLVQLLDEVTALRKDLAWYHRDDPRPGGRGEGK